MMVGTHHTSSKPASPPPASANETACLPVRYLPHTTHHTPGRPVSPDSLTPLPFSPGFVSNGLVYGPEGTQAGWDWRPYFAEGFWRILGASRWWCDVGWSVVWCVGGGFQGWLKGQAHKAASRCAAGLTRTLFLPGWMHCTALHFVACLLQTRAWSAAREQPASSWRPVAACPSGASCARRLAISR